MSELLPPDPDAMGIAPPADPASPDDTAAATAVLDAADELTRSAFLRALEAL